MSRENVEIVKRGLESYFATGEVPWALFDEDVEVHDHDTPDQGDYRGHAGYARWLEDWGEAWADWSLEAEQYLDAGDWVVVFVVMRTKGRGSGIETARQDAQLYRLRDGICVETDYYNDRELALKAVGLEE